MKKIYESPIVEITVFDVEDVITTSATTATVDTLDWTADDADAATHAAKVGAKAVGYYSAYNW